jgi:hypothetical protein
MFLAELKKLVQHQPYSLWITAWGAARYWSDITPTPKCQDTLGEWRSLEKLEILLGWS